jgi:transcriptional regulator with XRE-family HTH domain
VYVKPYFKADMVDHICYGVWLGILIRSWERIGDMKIATKHDLGLLLADRRKQLGMTQREFADFVAVPRLWIAQVETGTTNPTLTRLLDVLHRAGLSINVEPAPARDRLPPKSEHVDLDTYLAGFVEPGARVATPGRALS